MSPRAQVLLDELAAKNLRLRDLGTLARTGDAEAEEALTEYFRRQFDKEAREAQRAASGREEPHA